MATLETHPRLSLQQIELAERFAYATFLGRPLPVSAITVSYARDGKATPKVKVNCQTRQQWLESPDMRQLSEWIARGTDEDMMFLPTVAGGQFLNESKSNPPLQAVEASILSKTVRP